MVPKVVQDAGYTAVGLGVMAAQQIQMRRRDARARLSAGTRTVQAQLESVSGLVKAVAGPAVVAQIDRLPRLPGRLGPVLESGRRSVRRVLSS